MARVAVFLLILASWTLGGCAKIRRLLDLDGGAAPAGRTLRVAAAVDRTPAPKTVKCCWCVLKPGDRNSVQKYVGRASCEARSGKWPNGSCRAVEVEGTACTLVHVVRSSSGLRCTPNPLHYWEGGERREIRVPDDYQLTCGGARLAEDAVFSSAGDGDGDAPSAPSAGIELPPDEYCSCGRAPGDGSICQLVKVKHGITSVLASGARPKDADGCTGEVCRAIFGGSDAPFRPLCPRYVPGDP